MNGVERGVLIEQPFTRLMRSVISFSVAGKINGYQAAYDYESAYYQQAGHLWLTPLRRKTPKIMDIAEISNPMRISVYMLGKLILCSLSTFFTLLIFRKRSIASGPV